MTTGIKLGAARVLSATESLCPMCLERIDAQRVAEGDAVYLRKSCRAWRIQDNHLARYRFLQCVGRRVP